MPFTFRSKFVFPFGCACIAVLKLVLVSPNEIVAIADDSGGYVHQSLGAWHLFSFPPAYALWLSLCRQTGLPQRIVIELLFLFGSFLVAASIRRLFGAPAALLTYAFLAFTPSTYFLFDRALSDGFFTCVALVALGLSLRLFASRRVRTVALWSASVGLALGVLAVTRNEDPLIALWIIALSFGYFLLNRMPSTRIRALATWKKPLIVAAFASLAVYAVVFLVSFSYFLVDHVYARSFVLLPGHQRLLNNLAAIDTGERQKKWIPISRKSRELAYAASPTLSKVRARVEDPTNVFQIASRDIGLPIGQVGGGWIWHTINNEVFGLSGSNFVNTEQTYKKINGELEAAFSSGRLKRQFLINPLLGGDVAAVARQLPASVKVVLRSTITGMPDYVGGQEFEADVFDRALLRRAALVVERVPAVAVAGWAFVNGPGRKIAKVELEAKDGNPTTVDLVPRTDLVKGFNQELGWSPEVLGFGGRIRAYPGDIFVHYVLDDGTEMRSRNLQASRVTWVNDNSKKSPPIMQGIDLVKPDILPQTGLAKRLQVWLVAKEGTLNVWWLLLAVVILAATVNGFLWYMQRNEMSRRWLIVSGFVSLQWAAQVVFYSLIDAAGWPANQSRYLLPAHTFALTLIAISAGSLFQIALRVPLYVRKRPIIERDATYVAV